MSILPPWERKAAELVDATPTPDAGPPPDHAPPPVTSLDLGTVPAPSAAGTAPPPGTTNVGANVGANVGTDVGTDVGTAPAPHRSAVRTRWDAVPLRARLVAVLLVALIAALAATGYGVQAVLRGFLIGQIDAQLRDTYRLAQGSPRFLQGLIEGRNPGGPTPYVTRITVPGQPRLASTFRPRADGPGPEWRDPASLEEAEPLVGRPFTLAGSDGVAWRAISVVFTGSTTDSAGNTTPVQAVATMALSTASVEEAVEELRFKTLLIGGLAIVVVALLGWFAIRRSFAPLKEVEATAARIAAGDLSQRVPERPESTEVGRLTGSLNTMLGKIENAFRAQEASEARTRRFAADASHELRTPLASIRGFAELYRQGAVPEDEVPRTMRRIEDEAKRMGGLVEDLLLLARLDERRPGRSEPVDLAVLADDAVHDARGLDPERVVRLVGLSDEEVSGPAVVVGDEDRLRQVVANLVSNAVRHTPPGTPIEVAVGTDGGHAVLEVRDHGLGLTPEQSERVFERFYRVDSSRHRGSGGGSGLGLSIVAAVVSAHAGQVGVAPTPGGGATFTVRMPAAPAGVRPVG